MAKLSDRDKALWSAFMNGKSLSEISDAFKLKSSTIQTYLWRIKKKISDSQPKKFVVKKSSAVTQPKRDQGVQPRRCQTFLEFKNMMKDVVVQGTTLEERVAEFKKVYCQTCIYPTRCRVCPTEILMTKYLY